MPLTPQLREVLADGRRRYGCGLWRIVLSGSEAREEVWLHVSEPEG